MKLQLASLALAASALLTTAAPAQQGAAGATVSRWAEGLKGPQGIVLDANGEVLVAENGSGKILRFSRAGKLLGTHHEGLQAPSWLLRTPQGLLAAERKGNSVTLVSPRGARKLDGEVIDPLGMRLDPSRPGTLLVLSHRTSVIAEYQTQPGGSWKLAPRPFFAPAEGGKYGARDFLLQADGTLLITDELTNSVVRRAPGAATPEPWARGLSGPSGLFLAPNGDLYVTEEGNGRVSRILPDGSLKTVATGLGQARTGVFLDARTLLVTDRGSAGNIWKIVLPDQG